MSRPLRLELSCGLNHVTSRGDRREDIDHDDTDRETWLEGLAQCCERYHRALHAWRRMSNHYRLIVETAQGNLSAAMRQLNGVYTQKVKRRHARVGHVFQGLFKAILVERDSDLLELARYVVLNPVRAAMVRHARQWKWSSYPAMVGSASRPAWLNTEWLLGQLGAQRSRQIERCIDFVQEGVRGPGVWDRLTGQIYPGSAAFVESMRRELKATA
jgi:REP element-mobilizing transposase RayT